MWAPGRRGLLATAAALAAGVLLESCGAGSPARPAPSGTAGSRTTARGGASRTVTIIGAPGTFGRYTDSDTTGTLAVDGFGFGPGQAAYQSAVTGDGTVVIGTTPFTDNQAKPTATGMELGLFDPGTVRFTRLVIPSTTGKTTLVSPDPSLRGVGGGDVADPLVVPASDGQPEHVVFASGLQYFGWDPGVTGELPLLGQLARRGDGTWGYDAARSHTATDLARRLPPAQADAAFPVAGPRRARTSRASVALARLPRSGHLVIAQYLGNSGTKNGALLVVDEQGAVRAFWQYPRATPLGVSVVVNPRELAADPTSATDDERFVLVSDSFGPGGQAQPFTIQEFSYAASHGTVRPMSTAVRAAQDGSRMETVCFDNEGTLYVARTNADGLTAATLAVYPKTGGERALVTRTPAEGNWAAERWGATCVPDHHVAGTDGGSLVRSLTFDPASGAVLLAGVSGSLLAVRPSGTGARMTFQVGPRVDLGLNLLRQDSATYIGLRRGAVDARRRVLWLPVNQLVLDAITWPYPPFRLDQWLLRVDLTHLLGQ